MVKNELCMRKTTKIKTIRIYATDKSNSEDEKKLERISTTNLFPLRYVCDQIKHYASTINVITTKLMFFIIGCR